MAELNNGKYNAFVQWLNEKKVVNPVQVANESTQTASEAVKQGMAYAGDGANYDAAPVKIQQQQEQVQR